MTPRTHVVVVGGGQNCEHYVSLASATAVAAALDPKRYVVSRLTIGLDGSWCTDDGTALDGGLAKAVEVIRAADVVFPAVHGPRAEDGTLAALCELVGTPYVGCGVRAGALAMDKHATKRIAEGLGITTAQGTVVTEAGPPPSVDLPVVVKPVAAGSSIGVSRADTRRELEAAVSTALLVDDRVLVEEVVTGREVDIAVLERPDGRLFVGPALEIVIGARTLFDTDTKYDGTAEFRMPALLAPEVVVELEAAALAMFGALGCAGLARFDFFVTAGGIVLNEVNTMPGMTEHSQVPKMFAAVGLPYPRLLDMLIDTALARVAIPA